MVEPIEISKTFKADLAHIVETQDLPENMLCKCRFIHGHTTFIEAKLRGFITNSTRMILDYSLLKDFKDFINTYLDHCLILPVTTRFPYQELLNTYSKFYKGIYKEDATWKKMCSKTNIFEFKNTVLAKRICTLSILNTLSTTAEDMSVYLSTILAITLHNIAKRYNIDNLYQIEVSINFKETTNTSAISPYRTVKDIIA